MDNINNVSVNFDLLNRGIDTIERCNDTIDYDLYFKRYHWYTFYNRKKFGKVFFPDGVIRLVPYITLSKF